MKNANSLLFAAIILLGLFYLIFSTGNKLHGKHKNKPDTVVVDTSPIAKTIREFVPFTERLMDSCNTVGAAYTIVYEGKVKFTKTYGVRLLGTKDSVNEHTVFRLASVSKYWPACWKKKE